MFDASQSLSQTFIIQSETLAVARTLRVDALERIEVGFASLQKRVDAIELVDADISSLQTRVDALEFVDADISSLQTRVGALELFDADESSLQTRVGVLEEQFGPLKLLEPGTTLTEMRARLERFRKAAGKPVDPEDQLSRIEAAQITFHLAMLLQKFLEHESVLSAMTCPGETVDHEVHSSLDTVFFS
eukprot:CAMPEP_0194552530 /NCGR_PEP_ID=MMETSP0253-20130528/96776_1 /TAXON_ID=2966 /ORGANISM="Noctiluca scintillans" /LENGTH=188 /DNA_ID=CAMNT_0039400003 /DNA_START=368 /DNA_END=934 /DNA_ORIENTATION=+